MRVDRKATPVARRVHKRGQKKKAHYLASACMGSLMQLESRLEVGAAVVIGLDPRVRAMRSQPMCFDMTTGRAYSSKEELRQATQGHAVSPIEYTPDFEVRLDRRTVLVEVKHSELIRHSPQVLHYPSILARYGHRLIIVDESALPEELLRNMRLLNIAMKQAVPTGTLHALASDCAQETTFGRLLARGHADRAILVGIGKGILSCDLRCERISHDTAIIATRHLPAHLMELPLD